MDNTPVETSLVGALLCHPMDLRTLGVQPSDFENASLRELFATLMDLDRKKIAIDPVTVSDALHKKTGRDWLSFVGETARAKGAQKNVGTYAKLVRDASRKRQAVAIGERLVDDASQDVIDAAIRELMQLNAQRRDFSCSLGEALNCAIDQLDDLYAGRSSGIPTGLAELDECLGGFRQSDLIVIGARPAMGKTAFLLNLARNCAVPCGIISSEQGREQIGMRLLALTGRLSANKLRLARLNDADWAKITHAAGVLKDTKMFLNDSPAPPIAEVIRQARAWHYQYRIGILFVDYIQRLKALNTRAPKHEQVEEIAQALKELARELKIPVVALAQVNRSVESRPNKRPMMADLKDSGAIEQEADMILTLYRDDVYNEQSPDAGIAEISVLKNRHGPTGFFRVAWVPDMMSFENLAGR